MAKALEFSEKLSSLWEKLRTARPRKLALLGLLLLTSLCVLDLFVKFYLVEVFDLPSKGIVAFMPGLDLVYNKNLGVSFGLFPQGTDFGRAVLIAISLVVGLGCMIWLALSRSPLLVIGLAFLGGGTLGNGIDRWSYGGVTDFLYVNFGAFEWIYIFNLADTWIFIGAFLILIDNMRATKTSDTE